MTDTERQIFARLSMHEFMLEIVFAQYWASVPNDDAELARDKILQLMKNAYIARDARPEYVDDALGVAEDSRVMTERFLGKVLDRAQVIRAQSAKLSS